jgi:hypothetical protein
MYNGLTKRGSHTRVRRYRGILGKRPDLKQVRCNAAAKRRAAYDAHTAAAAEIKVMFPPLLAPEKRTPRDAPRQAIRKRPAKIAGRLSFFAVVASSGCRFGHRSGTGRFRRAW